jgi:hypothetical protein
LAIVSDVVRSAVVRRKIVVIGRKRRKTFTKVEVLICRLAIVC